MCGMSLTIYSTIAEKGRENHERAFCKDLGHGRKDLVDCKVKVQVASAILRTECPSARGALRGACFDGDVLRCDARI